MGKTFVFISSLCYINEVLYNQFTWLFKSHFSRPSDETLKRGPDSLWSFKNPMALLVKSRGVTGQIPGQIPSTGPFQLWPPNSQVKSSQLYLYSTFNNTNCVKATAQYQNSKIVYQ